ncbi:glycosyltransferase family 2 protein [Stenotrophomonas rhizophila]|uniref:glycosyltransferase family 2 protein n=1 Tax=Stenotrophomonas rhizophila TaxID=216778 RepID=UPI001E5512D8|nr:glycosyltransferase [Stenotrophomonas rhizophila]MCC7634028.1 glycosyltransferase [Stenotrophomonas rhizophila]MCC7662724.1 glycosyltransferase [Stenotrophomonas rhizophila]
MGTIVLLPIGVDDSALDRCLGALDAGTPADTALWLADDGQAGPRAQAVIEHWLAQTPLRAEYTRRARGIGEVAHLDEMLRACAGADVVVLAPDAVPAPGWLLQLEACFARDASIGSATPWCNSGETAAWPRLGEINPLPDDLAALAQACAALPPQHPELPSAVAHAVLLRGNARRKAGGLDMHSYGSWNAALVDLSLRMAGLGWRNALCETAFVARAEEARAYEGDLDALGTRWPSWQPRLAAFLMADPLRQQRQALQRLHRQAIMPRSQGDLFAVPATASPEQPA